MLQPTALRCIVPNPGGNTTFAPGALLRSTTTLTQDDLHNKRTQTTRRPDSLVEGKRKSDPSQEGSKPFSIKDAILNAGSGEGLFGRLGSGRSTQVSHATSASAVASRSKKQATNVRKISKTHEKQSGAKFYMSSQEKDVAVDPKTKSNRRSSEDAKNIHRDKHEVSKSASTPSKSWFNKSGSKGTTKPSDTSKGSSKGVHDPKDTHKDQDYAKAIAKELSESRNGGKDGEESRGRKKSVRRKFFKTRPQCTAPEDGTTTEEEVDGGGGDTSKKWTPHSNSLRRHYQGGHSGARLSGSGDPSHSDTDLGKISAPHSLLDGECGSVGGSSMTSERAIDVGRVGSWATSFEKLLEDPAGLHTFAEFLKKEYSHENIYFWTACERYKRLSSPEEMKTTARQIFERHLYSGAPEPVNVDSQARQDAQDGLHMPNESLFSQAQKQIFNLMKFDSYSRFLKSSLYQDCMALEVRGQPLPYPGDDTLDPDLRIGTEDSHVKLKKSRSDADERRRKSLLPWNRKDRSKSKDRGEAEYRRRKKSSNSSHRNASDSSSLRSDISGSRTSLNSSSDIQIGRRVASRESLTSGDQGSLSGSEGSPRCRVILPDLTNSVVAIKTNETIRDLMLRLLERRGLMYSNFDVYNNKTDKILDKKDDSLTLGGTEVRLEQRVTFQLYMPTQKNVGVYSKPTKTIGDVLKPILLKYGLKIDLLHIHKEGDDKMVNLKNPVTDIDNTRLIVQTKEEVKEWGVESGRQRKRGVNASLDEITNLVFEDLRNVKTDQHYEDMGVVDMDARSCRTDSSDKSSGILGSFSRRNSFGPEKDVSSSNSKGRKPRSSLHDNHALLAHPDHHALMSKRRGGNTTMQTKQENDELYEGLKRAQRSRLDDQRGTEINFELPDFLKCDQPQDKTSPHHLAEQLLARLECTFPEGVVATPAGEYFSLAHPEVWGGLPSPPLPPPTSSANNTLVAGDLEPDLDLDDFEDTLRGDGVGDGCDLPPASPLASPLAMEAATVPPRMPLTALPLSPPPLPPKPKVGGVRGPPPRPPSRQLHLLNPPPPSFPPPPPSTSNSEDEGGLCPSDQPPPLPPLHLGRQNHDKFNISFV